MACHLTPTCSLHTNPLLKSIQGPPTALVIITPIPQDIDTVWPLSACPGSHHATLYLTLYTPAMLLSFSSSVILLPLSTVPLYMLSFCPRTSLPPPDNPPSPNHFSINTAARERLACPSNQVGFFSSSLSQHRPHAGRSAHLSVSLFDVHSFLQDCKLLEIRDCIWSYLPFHTPQLKLAMQ